MSLENKKFHMQIPLHSCHKYSSLAALVLAFVISIVLRLEISSDSFLTKYWTDLSLTQDFFNHKHLKFPLYEADNHVLTIAKAHREMAPFHHGFLGITTVGEAYPPLHKLSNHPDHFFVAQYPYYKTAQLYPLFPPPFYWLANVNDMFLNAASGKPILALQNTPKALNDALQTPAHLSNRHLMILNLALHFLSTLILYFLVLTLYSNKPWCYLLAFCIGFTYIFSIIPFHFGCSAYWSHQLLQPTWLFFLLLYARYNSIVPIPALVALCIAIPMTFWDGLVFLGVSFWFWIYLWKSRKDRTFRNQAFITFGVSGATVIGYIAWVQYFSTWPIMQFVSGRYHERGTNFSENSLSTVFQQNFQALYGDYYISVLCILPVLAFGIFAYRSKAALSFKIALTPILKQLLIVFGISTLICSVIWVRHDIFYSFGRLKWALLYSLVSTVGVATFLDLIWESKVQTRRIWITLLLLTHLISAGLYVYYWEEWLSPFLEHPLLHQLIKSTASIASY